jgi:dipeptide/tripeptide permease
MESVAQPVTVYITGTLIIHGSYRVIFGVCAISMLAAMAVLAMIDVALARTEVAQRNLALDQASA